MKKSIPVRFESDDATQALTRLYALLSGDGLRPALLEIGEDMAESTRQRFVTSSGPDGTKWPPNAEATYLALLARRGGSVLRKDGRINSAGSAAAMGKKPLVDTGTLANSITYQLAADGRGVQIGTNWGDWGAGAAVHQFGSSDGRIPARPFLGLSAQDETNILQIVAGAIEEAQE